MSYQLLLGDCIQTMSGLPAGSVQTCVTSPPYYGLRDYGHEGQIGLEETPEAYVAKLVDVFREVRRVLRDDGTLWLNLGDSFWGGKGKSGYELPHEAEARRGRGQTMQHSYNVPGYKDMRPTDGKHPVIKPKDLIGIPWLVAFALRADGWWLRSDIIWHKPNPMPESVTDRPTKAHEYIFLLSKASSYYYDADAVREANAGDLPYGDKVNFKMNDEAAQGRHGKSSMFAGGSRQEYIEKYYTNGRNRRSVWTVSTKPFSGTKLLTDYVGADGKPYIASADCPIHGHLARTRKFYTVGYDEQSNPNPPHSDGNGIGHAPKPVTAQVAKSSHKRQDVSGDNVHPQTPESMSDYKNEADHPECTLGEGTLSRTSHSSAPHDDQDCKTDCSGQSCSEIATRHSNQKSRTAHVRQIAQRDNASAQSSFRTGNIPEQPALFGPHHDSGGYSISAGASGDSQDNQTLVGNADIDTLQASFAAYESSSEDYTCTCKICQIDHFATFPPDLIEPCILAGSRVGDTVLDPFNGSGTTGAVALKHGRKYIGCELNPDYIELAHERIRKSQPMLLEVS